MSIRVQIFAIFTLLLGLSGQAYAGLIISGDGDETVSCAAVASISSCSVTAISPHSAWQSNDPNGNGAVWISYADTGISPDSTLAPPAGSTDNPDGKLVIMTITETFFANIGDTLYLDVWADDTAEVFIDDVSVFTPNFTQDTCADGSIGCEEDEKGVITHTFTTAGTHTVDFDVFQVGTGTTNASNPFGLLYSGQVETPEPLSLILLGFGLAGLGFARRRL